MTGGRKSQMLQMWRKREEAFTIIEVLIVLAVTGMLFVSAVILIAGRQRQTEFNQSVRQIQSQIQQVINDVATGYFPGSGDFNCTAGASGPIYTSAAAGQGTNAGCIFLGKAIHFSPEQFRVFTVGGLRTAPSGGEAQSYAETRPKVVAPSTSQPSVPNRSQSDPLLYGLTAYEASYGTVKTNIGSFAILSSLEYSGGAVLSGSQKLNLVPVDGSVLGSTPEAAAEAINAGIISSPINPSTGVNICFVSGGTNQSALIKIGGSGRQLSVTLEVKSNKTCE